MLTARRTMALRGDAPPAPAAPPPSRVELAAEVATLRADLERVTGERDALGEANAGLAAALEQAPARTTRQPKG